MEHFKLAEILNYYLSNQSNTAKDDILEILEAQIKAHSGLSYVAGYFLGNSKAICDALIELKQSLLENQSMTALDWFTKQLTTNNAAYQILIREITDKARQAYLQVVNNKLEKNVQRQDSLIDREKISGIKTRIAQLKQIYDVHNKKLKETITLLSDTRALRDQVKAFEENELTEDFTKLNVYKEVAKLLLEEANRLYPYEESAQKNSFIYNLHTLPKVDEHKTNIALGQSMRKLYELLLTKVKTLKYGAQSLQQKMIEAREQSDLKVEQLNKISRQVRELELKQRELEDLKLEISKLIDIGEDGFKLAYKEVLALVQKANRDAQAQRALAVDIRFSEIPNVFDSMYLPSQNTDNAPTSKRIDFESLLARQVGAQQEKEQVALAAKRKSFMKKEGLNNPETWSEEFVGKVSELDLLFLSRKSYDELNEQGIFGTQPKNQHEDDYTPPAVSNNIM